MFGFLTVNTGAELICFFTAFFCLRSEKSPVWRLMIVFLFITCVTEILGYHFKMLYLADRAHARPNVWLYNILLVFQASFFSLMFNHILQPYVKSLPVILGGLAIFALLYIYELIVHGIFVYNEMTNTAMLVILILYSLYYYYCLFNDYEYHNVLKSADFWWATGILFFYFGTTVLNIFFDNILKGRAQSLIQLNYFIYRSVNVIFYSCWTYSIICKRWLTPTLTAQL